MELEVSVQLSRLLDVYGPLLTEKEANVFDLYINQNMSYSEIALNLGISKSAVMCFIKSAEEKLLKYEGVLKLSKIKTTLQKVELSDDINTIKNQIKNLLKEM